MDDDAVIILSDDCSDDGNFTQKSKSDLTYDRSALRDKVVSDFSVSDLPIVRFSEINCIPSSNSDLKNQDLYDSQLYDSPCLSDLREDRLTPNYTSKDSSKKNPKLSKDSYDLRDLVTDSLQEKEWSNFDLSAVNTENNNCPPKSTDDRNKSDSDSDYESQYAAKRNWRKNDVNVESSDDKEKSDDNEKKTAKKTVRKRRNKAAPDNDNDVCPKPTKKRGPKAASKSNPKDCIKLMEVMIDNQIAQYDFFGDFLKAAVENDIKYSVKSQLVPKSIIWKRKIEEADYEEDLDSNVRIVDENQLVIIWDCEETVNHVAEDTFVSAISSIKSLMPAKKISLIIYKMHSYFKYIKSAKGQAEQRNLDKDKQKKSRAKTGKGFSNYPRISRKKFDECLVEVQLLYNTSSRLIENSDDMVLLIQQYTKSLAALPSKKEQDEKLSEIDWCITVDNKDSVKIDKEGHGLTRLWQQQLCQFAQTSLETSEAIATIYKSPVQLMEAYAKCTQAEGELLLKDIPIRRNAGVLTSSKKIGPELSKKLYIMFTSTDGNVYLNANAS